MAFLPPDNAVQLTISVYVTVAATTVRITVAAAGDFSCDQPVPAAAGIHVCAK